MHFSFSIALQPLFHKGFGGKLFSRWQAEGVLQNTKSPKKSGGKLYACPPWLCCWCCLFLLHGWLLSRLVGDVVWLMVDCVVRCLKDCLPCELACQQVLQLAHVPPADHDMLHEVAVIGYCHKWLPSIEADGGLHLNHLSVLPRRAEATAPSVHLIKCDLRCVEVWVDVSCMDEIHSETSQ